MKMTRYSAPQILAILRQAEGGVPVAGLCREHGKSNASFYKWRATYCEFHFDCIGLPVQVISYSLRFHQFISEGCINDAGEPLHTLALPCPCCGGQLVIINTIAPAHHSRAPPKPQRAAA